MPEIDPHFARRIDCDHLSAAAYCCTDAPEARSVAVTLLSSSAKHGLPTEADVIELSCEYMKTPLRTAICIAPAAPGLFTAFCAGIPLTTYSARPITFSALAVVVVAEAGTALPLALIATMLPRKIVVFASTSMTRMRPPSAISGVFREFVSAAILSPCRLSWS